nr:glycosyltransferase [Nocardioides sp. zg-DK7169]
MTYVSEDGAYGGPVAVARMQCEQLANLGHEVHLVAGWDGKAKLTIPGVLVHLHRVHKIPGLGFAGYFSAGAFRELRALLPNADAVHFHFARDLVQLPAARYAQRRGAPVFLQAHGMVRPDGRLLAKLLDLVFVRPVYRAAKNHFLLTDREAKDLALVEKSARNASMIRNAVKVPLVHAAWPAIGSPRVIYVARLQARKRPLAFVEMAAILRRQGLDVRFDMFGADEGEGHAVRAAIRDRELDDVVRYHGPIGPDEVLAKLGGAQVYVLPSVDEPFPMSLLEAMAVGLPSVITDQTGLSLELAERGSAQVTDGSPEVLSEAVKALLTDPERWAAASVAARADISAHFSCEAVAESLETTYRGGSLRQVVGS